MTRDELEEAVRETFARQVAVPRPLAADPAGLAIRRADRSQRRRALSGIALAAVTTVAVSTGMAQLARDPGPGGPAVVVLGDPQASPRPTSTRSATPDPAPAAEPAEVDLILGDVLVTAAGRRVTLNNVGPVDRAQRLADGSGWLVVGAPTAAGRSLFAVRPNGVAQVLLARAEEIVLARDGRQVAWRQGTQLAKGSVMGNQVVAIVRHAAPAKAVPVGFVGDEVLLRLDPNRAGHALWQPARERMTTEADGGSAHVYGTRPDGLVVAQVSAGTPRRPCVGLLDPARGLAPVKTGCGPALRPDGYGAVSPDGRWLLVNGERTALLVDLDKLAPTPAARPAGPPLSGVVAWTPEAAVHVVADGGLVRIDPARVVAGEPVSPKPTTGPRSGVRPLPVTGVE